MHFESFLTETIISQLQVISQSESKIRQSKINSSSVPGPMGQMNRRPSV